MERYRMDDGTVVDTDNAKRSWEEASRFDGSNHISKATGSEWAHEQLYRSRKGRYYLERWSQWQGSTPGAEWISKRAAAAWLAANEHEIPDDLKAEANEVIE
ncbi:MAG: hypothetical protein ACREJC_07670 [Tepidisphaeraceae bacterium]